MTVFATANTSQEYKCLLCGNLGNIVRESQNDAEKKLKCREPRCGFVYSAKDSIDAMNAGIIPDGPRSSEAEQAEDSRDDQGEGSGEGSGAGRSVRETHERKDRSTPSKAPRSPSYVLLSKDRVEQVFATKKNLNTLIIEWTAKGKKFDLFELTPKKVQAKVLIQ